MSPQLLIYGLIYFTLQGLHAEKWTQTSLHTLINGEADQLRSRNEGCDRHTGKISPFSRLGLMSMQVHRTSGGEDANRLFSGHTVIYQRQNFLRPLALCFYLATLTGRC